MIVLPSRPSKKKDIIMEAIHYFDSRTDIETWTEMGTNTETDIRDFVGDGARD